MVAGSSVVGIRHDTNTMCTVSVCEISASDN